MAVEYGGDCAIAFARSGLQTVPIKQSYSAASVADEPPSLERAGRRRDARARNADHLGKEPLRERECIGSFAVRAREEPAAKPLLRRVKAMAGRRLRDLRE